VRGGITLLGSPASVYDCNGTLSQRWTVAADGTLRVAGSCALADGGAVQIGTCGDSAPGQWRAGPGASLVNVGTGQCLSDPDNGAKTGNRLQLAACGGNGQRWALP
jgi:Ricin-type beta-trefoil lectin domain